MKADLADVALIGGTPMERVSIAVRLRGLGFACFTEFGNRKQDKMFKRACDENRWGKGGVYDLGDPEDRAWLTRDDLAAVGL